MEREASMALIALMILFLFKFSEVANSGTSDLFCYTKLEAKAVERTLPRLSITLPAQLLQRLLPTLNFSIQRLHLLDVLLDRILRRGDRLPAPLNTFCKLDKLGLDRLDVIKGDSEREGATRRASRGSSSE